MNRVVVGVFVLVAVFAVVGFAALVPAARPTDAELDRAVRAAVYGKEPQTRTRWFSNTTEIVVPKELVAAYTGDPRATTKLLLAIVEGASPGESVLAAEFAFALLGSGGTVCLGHFNAKTYDDVREGWNVTMREHWAQKIRARINEKWPDKK